jgi:fatty acid desaturase
MIMPIDFLLMIGGVLLRQIDRWWFSPARRGSLVSPNLRPTAMKDVFALQRSRRNNVTPVLLMAGHWLEIGGILLLAGRPGLLPPVAAVMLLAVKGRHLQEVSHFGVHTALAANRRLGDLLTEFTAQGPMILATVGNRRESHVRLHHPHATIIGVDPNLTELTAAGMFPGCSPASFVRALVYPVTPRGLMATLSGLWWNGLAFRSTTRSRLPLVLALSGSAYLLGGWRAIVAVAVARLALYPLMAWFSLLVEHRWFNAEPCRGRPIEVETRRCVRVWAQRSVLALVARAIFLPYGDLYHFAHSVYPTIRWNYLPTVEGIVGMPWFAPRNVFVGDGSVLGQLFRTTRQVKAVGASIAVR